MHDCHWYKLFLGSPPLKNEPAHFLYFNPKYISFECCALRSWLSHVSTKDLDDLLWAQENQITNNLNPNPDKCLSFERNKKTLGQDSVKRDTKGSQVLKQKGNRLYQSEGKNSRIGIRKRERWGKGVNLGINKNYRQPLTTSCDNIGSTGDVMLPVSCQEQTISVP